MPCDDYSARERESLHSKEELNETIRQECLAPDFERPRLIITTTESTSDKEIFQP
jgi:hypothetical protein